jgi:tyrosyl-tRNA synthetase
MYGKTLSIPDDSLESWYQLLLGYGPPAGLGPRDAKRRLARLLVERFHGPDAAAAAQEGFDRVHVRHEVPDQVADVEFDAVDGVVHLPALLAHAFGVSTSEARRALGQGGVRLNGAPLPAGMLDVPGVEVDGAILQLGKRRFARVLIR